MPESIVQKKTAKLIQQELGDILRPYGEFFPGAMLTVSKVNVTADLSLAKIYLSVFPDQKLKEAVTVIEENNKDIRYQLAGRIKNKVRKIPELRFLPDDSYAHAENMNRLLDNLDIPEEEKD